MIKKLSTLQVAILEEGTTQTRVAEGSGVPRGYISLAIHGRYILDEVQKAKIAQVLNRKPEELFN